MEDLIFTGTPSGVGPVSIGDVLEGYLNDEKMFMGNIKYFKYFTPSITAIIYIIIWWIVFFAILPIDVNRNKTVKIEGEDPGSPENPKMLKKFLYCTGITTVIFVIIYLLMKYEYLNLRNIIN